MLQTELSVACEFILRKNLCMWIGILCIMPIHAASIRQIAELLIWRDHDAFAEPKVEQHHPVVVDISSRVVDHVHIGHGRCRAASVARNIREVRTVG